jgi:hypothetical protein
LFAGSAAGFALGYKTEQSRAKASSHATGKGKHNQQATTAAVRRLQRQRRCLAGHGVKWPAIPGKFATQVKKPPPGVATATYLKALAACPATAGSRAAPAAAARARSGP